ncbi:MAG: hypothetical protein V1810_02630 [Candidatus Beckwithbacteria bacterium]
MPFQELFKKHPKLINPDLIQNQQLQSELTKCAMAIFSLEAKAITGSITKPDAIILADNQNPKQLTLSRFGEVYVSKLVIEPSYLFIQITGEKVREPFRFIRIPLQRGGKNLPEWKEGIVTCQQPECYLNPPRDTTQADLYDKQRWDKPLSYDGKLVVAQLCCDVLEALSPAE